MKLKNNIFTALLLAIGFILHQITPGILGGMKFDFLLSFLFISLIVNTSFKNAVLTGLMGGLLSAITTTFPGGQIPNMIDKLLTSILLFLIIQFIRRFSMNTLAVGTISIFRNIDQWCYILTFCLDHSRASYILLILIQNRGPSYSIGQRSPYHIYLSHHRPGHESIWDSNRINFVIN